jgi:hypothetical protein
MNFKIKSSIFAIIKTAVSNPVMHTSVLPIYILNFRHVLHAASHICTKSNINFVGEEDI